MKIMNVSFSIDVKNVAHVQALTEFMAVLGEHGTGAIAPVTQVAAVPPAQTEPTKPVKEASAKKSAKSEKVEAQEQTTDTDPQQNATAAESKEETDTNGIDLALLRTEVSTLAKRGTEMRETLKAKLREFGAESVSTLDESHYVGFHAYLKTL